MLAGQLAQEVQRHAGRVGLRLIHVVLDVGKGVQALLLGQHLAVVVDAQLLAQLAGFGGLVKLVGAVGAFKADRESVIGHQAGGDIAGIHAAGQERAQFHIADAVGGYALPHAGVDLVGRLLVGQAGLVAEVRIPVALNVHLAVLVLKPVGRGQLVGAFKKGLVHGAVLERQVGAQRFGVDLPAETGMLQQALDLAAEQQLTLAGLGVVERFDAEHIAGAVQGIRLGIADNKGEHAAQLGGQGGAVFLVAVQDDLGITVGLENVTLGLQLGAQVHKVEDLAVENDDNGAVLVIHGLLAGGQVDDAQAAEAQGYGVFGGVTAQVVALHIRPAVDDAVGHPMQDSLTLGAHAGKTNKTTHSFYSFPLGCMWMLTTLYL